MKNMQKLVSLGAASMMLLVPAFAGRRPARTVTVTILRIHQIDNLDKGDALKKDRADFYANVKIGNGPLEKSENQSDDDARPGWKFRGTSSSRYVPIRIKIDDDDGGLEKKDDYVDVNPRAGRKDLNIVLDTKTGRISGDAHGKWGQKIYTAGAGDSDRAELWFMVK